MPITLEVWVIPVADGVGGPALTCIQLQPGHIHACHGEAVVAKVHAQALAQVIGGHGSF